MTTGEKICALRKEARITQEEFAEKLEVSRQAVSKWESDQSYPETDKIIRIAQMFGVTCDYLLNDAPRYESDVVDKRNREFITMMVSFSIACIAVGLIVALICFYAIYDWYCSLVGLGVLAGMLLAAFVLWSVGRYKFLSACRYSEEDKSHLARLTEILLYTAIITTFCYLPTVVFCKLYEEVSFFNTVVVFGKLTFGNFMLSQLAFIPSGILVAKIFSLIHDKFLGGKFSSVKLIDAICVAAIALSLTAAYCWAIYGHNYSNVESFNYWFYNDFGRQLLFVAFAVSSAVVLAYAVFHKIKEGTPTLTFILQILCALLLLANIICFNCNFFDEGWLSAYFNYAFGALLAVDAFALIALAVIQAINKNYSQLNHLRVFIPVCLFALIQLEALISADSSIVIHWIALHCIVFALPNLIKNK